MKIVKTVPDTSFEIWGTMDEFNPNKEPLLVMVVQKVELDLSPVFDRKHILMDIVIGTYQASSTDDNKSKIETLEIAVEKMVEVVRLWQTKNGKLELQG